MRMRNKNLRVGWAELAYSTQDKTTDHLHSSGDHLGRFLCSLCVGEGITYSNIWLWTWRGKSDILLC